MNRRISTKRGVRNMLVLGAALLGVWAAATSMRTDGPRQDRVISPAAMEAASRFAPLRETLKGEQVQHHARLT